IEAAVATGRGGGELGTSQTLRVVLGGSGSPAGLSLSQRLRGVVHVHLLGLLELRLEGPHALLGFLAGSPLILQGLLPVFPQLVTRRARLRGLHVALRLSWGLLRGFLLRHRACSSLNRPRGGSHKWAGWPVHPHPSWHLKYGLLSNTGPLS